MSATPPRTSSPRPPRQVPTAPVEMSGLQVERPLAVQVDPVDVGRALRRSGDATAAVGGVVEISRAVPLARTKPRTSSPERQRGTSLLSGPSLSGPSSLRPGPAPTRDLLLPNVLIPGVSHAGAAELAADLGRHADVLLPAVKRIGHFTPLRYGRPLHAPLEEYDRHFGRWSGQRYRLETGPDYFDGGQAMVRRMAENLPEARVVLILRDPVHRLWASYSDRLARGRLPRAMGFESYVDRCLALRANGSDRFEGNRHFRTLSSGFYAEYLPGWLETFGRRARVVFTEDLRDSPAEQVGALFDWLGLDRAAVVPDPRALPGQGYGLPEPVAPTARRWWPVGQRRTSARTPDARPAVAARRMPRQSERALAGVRELYAEANAELAALLRDRGYSGLPEWLAQP